MLGKIFRLLLWQRLLGGDVMITPYVFALFWVVCGGLAWKIATSRKGRGPLWAVLGQVFGPLSIPFAFMAGPKT